MTWSGLPWCAAHDLKKKRRGKIATKALRTPYEGIMDESMERMIGKGPTKEDPDPLPVSPATPANRISAMAIAAAKSKSLEA